MSPPALSPLEREQIPDSVRWARFRGVARLARSRATPVIASVWVALTVRHGARLLDFLRRLLA